MASQLPFLFASPSIRFEASLLFKYPYALLLGLVSTLIATPLSSTQGITWLQGSLQKKTLDLMNYHVSQATTSFCGIASSVTILNTLIHQGAIEAKTNPSIEQTLDPRFLPGNIITQQSFFFLPHIKPYYNQVHYHGLKLPQLQEILQAYPLKITHHDGKKLSLKQFRKDLKVFNSNPQYHLIVNYYRPGVNQHGGGHYSPVAAYNTKADQVLILDTSTYKESFFWASSQSLWEAMRPNENCSLGRGYLVLQPKNSDLTVPYS